MAVKKDDWSLETPPAWADEKIGGHLSSGADPAASSFGDWTEKEESKLVHKVDLVVMPILMLCFFALQLDRANIGNALTDHFLVDVGITQNWFNVGQQLLNTGIVLLEIPSNIVLYRLGPKVWISCQILAWSLVAIFQAFQHGLAAFLTTRLLLGLLEAGFIPGGLYTLSLWYKRSELSKRFALFFLGNGLATASGGLFAYGILHMRGVAGLTGWQWMFILEGIFTVLAGVVFACLFPGSPDAPVSIIGVKYFSEAEQEILRMRIIRDDPTKEIRDPHIRLADIAHTLADPKLWPHILLTIIGLAPSTALWSYAPSIVASFGYNSLTANAMTSIGQWISVLLVVIAGFIADRWDRRGFFVLVAVTIELAFTVAYRCLADDAKQGTKFAVLTLAAATCSWWHAVHGSWLSINAQSPAERSIRMAIFIMSANCAGIVGGQLFRSDDLPYYHRGWNIAVAFMAMSVICVIVLIALYAYSNKSVQTTRARSDTSATGTSNDRGEETVVGRFTSGRDRMFLYNF